MTFIAEYTTTCTDCDEPLSPGQVARMTYDGAAHDRCPRPAGADRPACPRCHMIHGVGQKECE